MTHGAGFDRHPARTAAVIGLDRRLNGTVTGPGTGCLVVAAPCGAASDPIGASWLVHEAPPDHAKTRMPDLPDQANPSWRRLF